ncbi:MAG: hypothetical protein V1914_04495 [archaeon]
MANKDYYLVLSDMPGKDPAVTDLLDYLKPESEYLANIKSHLEGISVQYHGRFMLHHSTSYSILETPRRETTDRIFDNPETALHIARNMLRVIEIEPKFKLIKRYSLINKLYKPVGSCITIATSGEAEDLVKQYNHKSITYEEEIARDINSSERLQDKLVKRKWSGKRQAKPFSVDQTLELTSKSMDIYSFNKKSIVTQEFLRGLEEKILLPLRTPNKNP